MPGFRGDTHGAWLGGFFHAAVDLCEHALEELGRFLLRDVARVHQLAGEDLLRLVECEALGLLRLLRVDAVHADLRSAADELLDLGDVGFIKPLITGNSSDNFLLGLPFVNISYRWQ